jgi:hypothetical protein
MDTLTAPRFQIENVGWPTDEPDDRPRCTACAWSWQPGDDDDLLGSRLAAALFARATHRICRPGRLQIAA